MTVSIHQAIVAGSRAGTGSAWRASTTINGETFEATSRHGAAMVLARHLVAAGIADQGVIVTTDDLAGSTGWRSLHHMATRTMSEGSTTRLHSTRWVAMETDAMPSRGTSPDAGNDLSGAA